MENKTNKLIAAHYQLFAIDDKAGKPIKHTKANFNQ